MNFNSHGQLDNLLGTGIAAAIALAGLTLLVNGFVADDDDATLGQWEHVEAMLERLSFARVFAYGEVIQAAADALSPRVPDRLPAPGSN